MEPVQDFVWFESELNKIIFKEGMVSKDRGRAVVNGFKSKDNMPPPSQIF